MAIDFALNPDLDLLIFQDDYQKVSGSVEVAQAVTMRLMVQYKECIYGPNLGTDWIGKMFNHQVSEREKRQHITRRILGTPGVDRLLEFQYGVDPLNHGGLIEFKAKTIYNNENILLTLEV